MSQDPLAGNPPQNDPPAEPDPEEGYWKKFEEKAESVLNKVFESKLKELTGGKEGKSSPPPVGTSRTGGRVTVPNIVAQIMGGPFKPKE